MVDVADDVQIRVTRTVSSWHQPSQLIEAHSQGGSESPLLAAYFAAENAGVGREPPGIYAVSGLPVLKGDEDPFALQQVSIYKPPHISPRIPAQTGLFTVHTTPAEGELTPPRAELWQLAKTRETFWLKRILDRCGISRAALFPDLDRLAMHLGWRYKWGM